ncbi:hypothetical protein CHS0354_020753 [Potamilus streckersoni]|uniref:4-hydroxy-2-oxoglutarate aldolase, mitochondrial n=1 Tax=Potamilus streckersoni TaxID=2493646 RepID=A0AAE0VTC5_9BIVA|nr:hypothetical protein CHS0354_020753 [Potamilus streckersoni]
MALFSRTWTKLVRLSKHVHPAEKKSVRPIVTSARREMDISGIYPPIATPFRADESIDYGKLEENINKWNQIPFRGYVVQGSNGEYAYLTKNERVELVSKVATMVPKDKLIIAGAGCESTRDTIEMTKLMSQAGAKAVLVVTPCFYKGQMTNEAMINHFTKQREKKTFSCSSTVPVILYSVPGNTTIDLAPEVIITLSKHPNIIGLKDSGGDVAKLANLVYKTKGNNFQILAGSASFLLPAYAVGCVGGVLGLANVLGHECCMLENLFKKGKMEEAKILQQRLVGPNVCVTRRFGVPGLKVAMEWFGYYGGPTRSPLQPISKETEEIIRQTFISNGFV